MVKKTALAFSEMDHAEQVDPQDVWEVDAASSRNWAAAWAFEGSCKVR